MENSPIPAWQLWRNPILVRYARARLRWKGLLLNGVPTLILTTFVFLIAFYAGLNGRQSRIAFEEHMALNQAAQEAGRSPTPEEYQRMEEQIRVRKAEQDVMGKARRFGGRWAFMAVFVVQCLILMLRGTFSVASGVTREGIEGILEYQRLTPMSPIAKIIGYVLGLPIRETVLCVATAPFTFIAMRIGEIPWELAGKLYLVMVSSALLYHITGFLAGIVVKNRFMAGLLSQMLMLGLYLFLPQLSRLGYVIFEYLTVRPLFAETLDALFVPFGSRPILSRAAEPFFDTEIPLVWCTLMVQGFLFAVFLLVVYRRVRNDQEHLLGKISAVPVLAGFLTILLGTVLPGIESGAIFPSQSASQLMSFGRGFRGFRLKKPPEGELMAIPGLFGFALLVVLMLAVFMITPTEDQRIKGLRLAKKLGRRSVAFHSDAATSLPTTMAVGALGMVAWMLFLNSLLDSRWYAGWSFVDTSWILFPLALAAPLFCFQLVLQSGGRAFAFLAILFVWFVPPMAGLVILLATQEPSDLVIYLMSVSGLSLPINAMRIGFDGVDDTPAMGAFRFSLILHFIALLVLGVWSSAKRTRLRSLTSGETAPAPGLDS